MTRSLDRPLHFSASPPEVGLTSLIAHRKEEIVSIEREVGDLQRLYESKAEGRPTHPLVETVLGREAAARWFALLERTAREEVWVFTRHPYALPADENDNEFALLRRGVSARGVYEEQSLRDPLLFNHLRRCAAAGEQVRVTAVLPMKLAIADHHLALVPLSVDGERIDQTLVVHGSWLLEALRMLFEMVWERAVGLGPNGKAAVVSAGNQAGSTREDGELLTMLSVGLKDAAIGHHLGLSERTVQRRVSMLMTRLGAQTRFQAGLQAARRGLL